MTSLTVIKFGALGDVLRTSYLINAISEKKKYVITWITSKQSYDLLKFNPHIHEICIHGKDKLPSSTDILLCLEDDYDIVSISSNITTRKHIGSYIDNTGEMSYTSDTSEWFDMSLISRYGIKKANKLKLHNNKSFNEIFYNCLEVKISDIKPHLYSNRCVQEIKNKLNNEKLIGLNLFAGNRWPSKELTFENNINLIKLIYDYLRSNNFNFQLCIFCDNSTIKKAQSIKSAFNKIKIINTNKSTLDFSNAVNSCDYIITTDSLGMHLAIANNINHLSFFIPTSAAEIDSFGCATKVISDSYDYCSYKPDADNLSLSAEKIFKAWIKHIRQLKWYNT